MENFYEILEKYHLFLGGLRRRLYHVVILFFATFIGSLFLISMILKRILKFLPLDKVTISTSSPFQFVDIAMNFGFFMAAIICLPYIFYSLYNFIAPALTKEEKKKLLWSAPMGVVLFICGFFYGFFTLYYSLALFAEINIRMGIANFWNISQFITEIFFTSTVLGLVFEFPILLTLLIKFGIISTQTLKKNRRVAYCVMLLFVGLLPPPEVMATIIQTVPLILLYEMTILLNKNNNKYTVDISASLPPLNNDVPLTNKVDISKPHTF